MKLGALLAIASLVACSAPEEPCESCLKTGDACDISYQCPAGDICNVSDGADPELSDLTKPGYTCITVVCANDDECTAPRTCTLEHLCRVPVCASDAACPGGDVCVRGTCRSIADTDVARCEVLGRRIVAHAGERIEPRAYAFDRSNRLLPHVDFTWTTSDREGGDALLTAHAGTRLCTGQVPVSSFASIDNNTVRAIVVFEDGRAVRDARVVLDAPDGEHETRTSSRGEAIFQANAVDAITVAVEGRPLLVIIQPGAKDLLLTVQEDRTAPQGGLRGSVDLALLSDHDIRMGYVGLSFPEDLLDFDPSQLIGEPTTVTIDAPELSLNNMQVTLPSGFMLALGARNITELKPFCDRARNADLLDCYFLHAPPSFRSVWTLSGSLTLSEVTPLATDISSGAVPFDFISGAFGAWAHSAGAPMLMSGELVDQDLALDSALRVLSIVRAPKIPPGAQATLIATSDPFGSGFVPLGITAVHDDDGDGFVDSADHPFGVLSDAAPRGTIAIASAPRYGAEPFAWMLLAVDQLKRAFSMRVAQDELGDLLAFPANARVDADGTLEAQVDPRANVVRYDVQADVGVARVYAPAGLRVVLPRVASARVVRVVEAAEIAGPFSDLWSFPRRAEVSAFAVRSF